MGSIQPVAQRCIRVGVMSEERFGSGPGSWEERQPRCNIVIFYVRGTIRFADIPKHG